MWDWREGEGGRETEREKETKREREGGRESESQRESGFGPLRYLSHRGRGGSGE